MMKGDAGGAHLAQEAPGGALFLQAPWLLWRSHADLAESFSPGLQIREDHRLVTTGVRERVRHPMYAAHLLWAVAQLLLLQNWIAGLAFLVASIPLYVARIPREGLPAGLVVQIMRWLLCCIEF